MHFNVRLLVLTVILLKIQIFCNIPQDLYLHPF